MAETIKVIADQLSRVFRHMLPGLIVVCAARLAYPHWFHDLKLDQSWHVAALVAITLAVGNTWYVFHRYIIHQALDMVFYMRRESKLNGYRIWLTKLIYDSFICKSAQPELRAHVHFRSAQIILILIVAEVAILFSYWHTDGTFFDRHAFGIRVFGILSFIAGAIQSYIGDTIDRETIVLQQQYLSLSNQITHIPPKKSA